LMTTTIQAATTGASTGVTALAEGVIRAMFFAKCKIVLIGMAVTAMLVGLLWGANLATGGGKGAKSDKELLQGAWKIVSADMGGKKADDDELARMQEKPMVFKGDKLISRYESDFKLDPTKDPKEIDVVPLDGPETEKGKTFRGIYRLEGDQLTICTGLPDGVRPKGFTPQAGDPEFVLLLKRVKDSR
jgi:uncharacterized protein (TIGR03067 family)